MRQAASVDVNIDGPITGNVLRSIRGQLLHTRSSSKHMRFLCGGALALVVDTETLRIICIIIARTGIDEPMIEVLVRAFDHDLSGRIAALVRSERGLALKLREIGRSYATISYVLISPKCYR